MYNGIKINFLNTTNSTTIKKDDLILFSGGGSFEDASWVF